MLTSEEVRGAVERAERRFVDACTSATEAAWRYQPAGTGDRGWTIPQVIEHVIAANERILRLLRKVVVHSPLAGQTLSFDDEDMPYLFYGGGGPAPPDLDAPQGRLTERDASLASFRASVRSLTSWFDEVDIDLRECAVEHPAFGLFDGAQWLLFTAVHMQQHRGQVLDIRCASDQATGPLV